MPWRNRNEIPLRSKSAMIQSLWHMQPTWPWRALLVPVQLLTDWARSMLTLKLMYARQAVR
jgi:hypothetical protein